jgi:hypothetical protein
MNIQCATIGLRLGSTRGGRRAPLIAMFLGLVSAVVQSLATAGVSLEQRDLAQLAQPAATDVRSAPEDRPEIPESPIFLESAGALGVDFIHSNGMGGKFYFPEVMGSGVALLDYDNDGDLDLYVGNYVDFTLANHKSCYWADSAEDYCSPLSYKPVSDRLFRSRGTASFEDVSTVSGIVRELGNGLGVVVAEFNGDGWLDIYVGNDAMPNQLWVDQKDGTFRDEAMLAGVAVNMDGAPEASMGVDAGDFDGDGDGDGDEDLFVTHLLGETNTIYVNDGRGWFEDRTIHAGLAVPSKVYTSFGTAWIDYDNHGWLNLFVANGAVRTIASLRRAGDPYPLHQPNQLFANLGNARFREVTAQAGSALRLCEVSRGGGLGDPVRPGHGLSGARRRCAGPPPSRLTWAGRAELPGSRHRAARAALQRRPAAPGCGDGGGRAGRFPGRCAPLPCGPAGSARKRCRARATGADAVPHRRFFRRGSGASAGPPARSGTRLGQFLFRPHNSKNRETTPPLWSTTAPRLRPIPSIGGRTSIWPTA